METSSYSHSHYRLKSGGMWCTNKYMEEHITLQPIAFILEEQKTGQGQSRVHWLAHTAALTALAHEPTRNTQRQQLT